MGLEDFNRERYYDWAKHRWYEVKRRKSQPRHRNVPPEGYYTGVALDDVQPQMRVNRYPELCAEITEALKSGPLGLHQMARLLRRDAKRLSAALHSRPDLYERTADHPKAPWQLKGE